MASAASREGWTARRRPSTTRGMASGQAAGVSLLCLWGRTGCIHERRPLRDRLRSASSVAAPRFVVGYDTRDAAIIPELPPGFGCPLRSSRVAPCSEASSSARLTKRLCPNSGLLGHSGLARLGRGSSCKPLQDSFGVARGAPQGGNRKLFSGEKKPAEPVVYPFRFRARFAARIASRAISSSDARRREMSSATARGSSRASILVRASASPVSRSKAGTSSTNS